MLWVRITQSCGATLHVSVLHTGSSSVVNMRKSPEFMLSGAFMRAMGYETVLFIPLRKT